MHYNPFCSCYIYDISFRRPFSMNYWVSRGGQQYGPYALADLQRYVASGNILPTDMARSESMNQWLPVSQILAGGGGQAPQPPAPQAATPQPQQPQAQQPQAPQQPAQPSTPQQPSYGQPAGASQPYGQPVGGSQYGQPAGGSRPYGQPAGTPQSYGQPAGP